MFVDRVREVTRKVGLYARVLRQTGALAKLRPAGAVAGVRTLLRGAGGPSAIFRFQAANGRDRPAFLYGNRALSYGEVDRRIDHVASALRRRGFARGDCAVLMLKNRPECVELGAAMSRLGGAGVAVSWRSTAAELTYLVTHSGARAIFFEAELWPVVEAARAGCPRVPADGLFAVGGAAPGCVSAEDLLVPVSDGDLGEQEGAVIIYTSGTTGRPKGAVRRFGPGQLEGFFAFIGETPMRVDDRHLAVCPLYHSTGIGFVGMALMLGATVIIARDFDPEQFLATIERERVTTTALVPTMLYRLMALPEETLRRYDTRSLRAVFCGGAQLPGTLAARAMGRLGPVLYNFYGATETGLCTLAKPADLYAAPGTIGRALPGTEVRLLDPAGAPVPRGQVGELYVRNAMLVAGYHEDAAATQQSMRDGFFSVGDLAMQDPAGRYHLAGRQRDMVISGGVNVYPVEIEAVLEGHADVAQAAVIGVADEEWGERLRAFVVARAGRAVTAADLRAHCRERLAGFKVPRDWVFTDKLPANPTGKVLKRELGQWSGAVEQG